MKKVIFRTYKLTRPLPSNFQERRELFDSLNAIKGYSLVAVLRALDDADEPLRKSQLSFRLDCSDEWINKTLNKLIEMGWVQETETSVLWDIVPKGFFEDDIIRVEEVK